MAKQAKQKVTFSYIAPGAQKVEVVGDFTGWQLNPLKLKPSKDGVWKGTVSLLAGRYEYRLLVDGEWRDDPRCSLRQPNEFGTENCVCVVEAAPEAPAPAAVSAPVAVERPKAERPVGPASASKPKPASVARA